MKARIPKDYFQQDEYELVSVEDDEYVPKSVPKSTLSGMIVTKDDVDTAKRVLGRHMNLIPNDIYGRSDVFGNIMHDRISRGLWPTVPDLPKVAILSDNTESLEAKYKRHGDNLIKQYMDTMIKINMSLSPDILQTLPIIDLSNALPVKKKDDPTSTLRMTFSEQEMHDVREYGWKVFIPYFDEQIIRVNKNRYIYVKSLSQDKRSRKLTLHIEIYVGDTKVWLCTGKGDVTYKFGKPTSNEPAPCEITIEKGDVFEFLLTKGIKATKWDKKTRTMWCDMFGCPEKISDCNLVYLNDNREDADGDNKVPSAHVFANTKQELSALKKIFGNCCTQLTNQDFQMHYDGLVRYNIVPEYLRIMSILFFALQAKPTSVTDSSGILTQTYGNVVVKSKEKIKRRV